ncbi:hypothetical protein SDC9_115797 [bioreactor metagenome]|uniref:DUF3796 domain-containing protein n=1 Tax=bioreactor metagenome TaxID=1076179 RepID=A0A645BUD2_9ZZZZ
MHKKKFFLGFIGFIGFWGFQYFASRDIADLCYFAFFSYFAYFWFAKIKIEIQDERYLEDVQKAKAFAFDIALYEILALFLLTIFFTWFQQLLILGISLCYASLVLIYAIKLYMLEEK